MTLYKVFAAGIAAVVLLAGCGGGSAPGSGRTPSASASANAQEALLAVARCLRTHGYPSFPDPTQNPENGTWVFPDSVPRRINVSACDSLIRRAKALNRKQDQQVSAAEMTKLRQYAACMRREGVADWPDPGPNGAFLLPPRLAGPNGIKRVEREDKACEKYRPAKMGIRIEQPAPGGN